MAADPQIVKASQTVVFAFLKYLVPIAVVGAIVDALSKPGRRTRRRSRKDYSEDAQAISILAILGLGYLFVRNQTFFWLLVFAIVFVGILVFFLFRAFRRRNDERLFQSQNTLEKLRSLTPTQFESYIVLLFDRLGYDCQRVGGSHDGGIDVVAIREGQKHYIQCKKFITRQVSVHDVRDFYGAVTGLHANAKSFFITTHVFTPEAREFCNDKPLELIDGMSLLHLAKQAGVETDVPSSVPTEQCPRDGGTLVERQGKFGSFVGCSNYPRCKYTKSL